MRRGAAALVLAAVLPATAQAQDARTRMLGEEWVGADGNRRIAKIGLGFDQPARADAELVRRLEINWRDFPYQKGPFPVPVGEEDARAQLRVTLDIDDAGVPRDCRIAEPSGTAAFDEAACPFLLSRLRLYPALTREGKRVGGKLGVRVTYSAGRLMSYGPGGTLPTLSRPKPTPLKPIDAAAIGFSSKDGLPAHVGGASGWLRVEADGSVSSCTLAAPTQNDRFDLGICERLRSWPFKPALDQTGTAVAADYGFGAARR